MTNVSISVTGVKEVNKRLTNLKRYVATVMNAPASNLISAQAGDASLEIARKKYKTPANKPRYPLRWKSDKQRIAVIIRLKEEGNLPYQRTGRLENAWSVSIKPKVATIANTARDRRSGKFIAPFVIAEFQQPFHADTGHTKASEPIEMAILKPMLVDMQKNAIKGIVGSKNG